jgi:hypothetical protein
MSDLQGKFKSWKGYPLPPINSDGQYDKEYLNHDRISYADSNLIDANIAALKQLSPTGK